MFENFLRISRFFEDFITPANDLIRFQSRLLDDKIRIWEDNMTRFDKGLDYPEIDWRPMLELVRKQAELIKRSEDIFTGSLGSEFKKAREEIFPRGKDEREKRMDEINRMLRSQKKMSINLGRMLELELGNIEDLVKKMHNYDEYYKEILYEVHQQESMISHKMDGSGRLHRRKIKKLGKQIQKEKDIFNNKLGPILKSVIGNIEGSLLNLSIHQSLKQAFG